MDLDAHRTVTVFRWRIRINSLSSWWYCACALAVEGYLLYRAVTLCVQYNELPWKAGNERPVFELWAYIALIVINVMCVPFIVVFSLFQVGNYANDGVRLGRDSTRAERILIQVTETGDEIVSPDRRAGVDVLSSWRHVGPLSQGFHVLAAFCLLLPRILVQAQEIKNGFLPIEAVWLSDFDSIVGRHGDNRPMDLNSQSATSIANISSILPPPSSSLSSTPTGTNSHPFLGSTAATASAPHVTLDSAISVQFHPEFLNYCLALFFYSLRYAAVFWYTEIALSLLFSFQLILTAVYFAVSFCGTSVLYKILVNPEVIGPDDHNFMLSSILLLGLYLAANFIAFLSPLSVFNFGYLHYRRAWKLFLKRGLPVTARLHNDSENAIRMDNCCHGYTQHVLATVYLLAMVGLRLPVVFDYVTVYKASSSLVILTSLLADAVVMLGWVFLWFLFTVRQRWNFKVILTKQLVWDAASGARVDTTAMGKRSRTQSRIEVGSESRSELRINHQTGHSRVDITTNLPTDAPGQATVVETENAINRANHNRVKTPKRPETRTLHSENNATDGDGHRESGKIKSHGPKTGGQKRAVSGILCGCATRKSRDAYSEGCYSSPRDPRAEDSGQQNAGTNQQVPTEKRRKRKRQDAVEPESKPLSPDAHPPGTEEQNDDGVVPPDHQDLVECGDNCPHVLEIHCSHPEDPCDAGVGGERTTEAEEPEPRRVTRLITEDTLIRGYRSNVRDKCGQYFHHARCHNKGVCEKPFRKRPPAPPPSPNPVQHAATVSNCELATFDSSMHAHRCNHAGSRLSEADALASGGGGAASSLPVDRLVFPGRTKIVVPRRMCDRTAGMSCSTVVLTNPTAAPSIQELCPAQLLSRSVDTLGRGGCCDSVCNTDRLHGGDGSDDRGGGVSRPGPKRTSNLLDRPHSSCMAMTDGSRHGGQRDIQHDTPSYRLKPDPCSLRSFGDEVSPHGSHSNCQHACSLSSISRQFLLPPPPPSPPLPPPPPPPLGPAPTPPTQRPVEAADGMAALPKSVDASSSDSTNSQVLCSQV